MITTDCNKSTIKVGIPIFYAKAACLDEFINCCWVVIFPK